VAAAILLVGSEGNAAIKGQLAKLEMDSKSLHRKTAVYVYLPPGYDRSKERLPVAYLLHGNPGKSSDWFSRGHIEQTVDNLIVSGKIRPLIMVAADCFGSGGPHSHDDFLNSNDGSLMAEDFVAHELPAWVDAHYRTIRSPEARALSGLSSGGYGALNVGSKHTEVFHILVCHSGFVDLKDEPKAAALMLGPQGPLWDANNPLKQVKNWRAKKSLHVYLDIGSDDELLPESRDLAKALDQYGIDHIFSVLKGAHEWSLWQKQFAVSIACVDRWFHS
jgi:enterochelin esterase-like enzyme